MSIMPEPGQNERKHLLLPDDLARKFPAYGRLAEASAAQIKTVAKFFTPDSHWTWYAYEASAVLKDGGEVQLRKALADHAQVEDVLFMGFVAGRFPELGSFCLSELMTARGPLGLLIERDLYYDPEALDVVMARHPGF